jgi:hypothetical protein
MQLDVLFDAKAQNMEIGIGLTRHEFASSLWPERVSPRPAAYSTLDPCALLFECSVSGRIYVPTDGSTTMEYGKGNHTGRINPNAI